MRQRSGTHEVMSCLLSVLCTVCLPCLSQVSHNHPPWGVAHAHSPLPRCIFAPVPMDRSRRRQRDAGVKGGKSSFAFCADSSWLRQKSPAQCTQRNSSLAGAGRALMAYALSLTPGSGVQEFCLHEQGFARLGRGSADYRPSIRHV